RALENEGSVHLLSQPELLVRAPGESQLFSGGEFPVLVRNRLQTTVVWKNFGLTLNLQVKQAAGAQVRLDLSSEMSHLDPSLTVEEIPGIQSNRMKTQIDVEFERPIVLSGLIQDELRKEARGLPLLRRIPVLGKLFSSEDFLESRSELVVVLLPSKKDVLK
ncbi:pilus assembly protein, partial [bacterium]|nr:pilus assembly protein [bacterium]